MLIDVTMTRGGKPLISSVTQPLNLGVHTGMRLGGWSFELNTRTTTSESPMRMNLDTMKSGGVAVSFYVRKLMERVPDFETAIKELYAANFAADAYFVWRALSPMKAQCSPS